MNGDALSDLLLALSCFFICAQPARSRPGFAWGCASIGLAAALGVARYSGVVALTGPHRFFSMLASCAGMPLLAESMRWPNGESARSLRGATLFLFMASLIAIVLVAALGFEFYAQLVPAGAAALLLYTAISTRRALAIVGSVLLAATFVATAVGFSPRPLHLNRAETLHYGMVVSLLLLAYALPAVHPRELQR